MKEKIDLFDGNAEFSHELLGWKAVKGKFVPNNADSDNQPSIAIATEMLLQMGATEPSKHIAPNAASGRLLELAVAKSLEIDLPKLDNFRNWSVNSDSSKIWEFVQYEHLKAIDQIVLNNANLKVTLGMDYQIIPDVTVALPPRNEGESEFLHGAVSCKWTIRSDRVQNIRHENLQMIRHRRERLPHLVTVTAEPLPTRLASIARGTGEVDAVYHIAFDVLDAAMRNVDVSRTQKDAWLEVTEQGRVRPYSDLSKTLALW